MRLPIDKQDPNIFPSFNLRVAMREGHLWAKQHPEIQKILLVRDLNPHSSQEPKWTIIWKVTKHPYSSVLEFVLNMEKEFKPGFEDIYKEGGFYNWRKEWCIKVIGDSDILPDESYGNNYWVLFIRPTEDNQNKKRKPSPSSTAKKIVREIAKDLWKKEPDITKADMAMRDEITIACTNIGREYAVSTIEKWIKDLNPNRKPGRRKQKPRERK